MLKVQKRILSSLPGPLTTALRGLRTGLLWALGPLDAAKRRREGRGNLPPLWLRRHVGDPRAFESSAGELLSFLDARDLLPRTGALLDIGCGCGALALALRSVLAPNARYVGFDVHAPSLRWARRAFRDDSRFQFHLAALRSPYGGPGGDSVESYGFPLGDGEADLVVAKSVFTHLLPSEARHYLKEVRRTLGPRGRAVITTFLFDCAVVPPLFPFFSGDGRIRWKVKSRPQAAIAYDRPLFESMLAEPGLESLELVPGFWPGQGVRFVGQDTFVLKASPPVC